MNSSRDRAAGGRAVLAMLGLPSLLAGVVLVGVGVAGQVPDPPRAGAGVVEEHRAHPAGAAARPAAGGSDEAAETSQAELDPQPETASEPAVSTQSPSSTQSASTTKSASSTQPQTTTVKALPASEPVAVRLPTLGVDSPLHALGLAADGTLEVPSGALVDQAAWYSGSPTPGEIGPSVVEGHVTGPGGRPSVFFELAALTPGARVEVDRADGSTVVFEVYRVESYPKDQFPTVAVYGPAAGPELRLITCGGEFDEGTGHHVDNTVVFARAVADDLP